jgi:hypothetical protein
MKKSDFKWWTPLRYIYQRYLIQAMGSIALGIFASLVVGLILTQIAKVPGLSFFGYASEILASTSPVVGAAIGVSIAYGLKSAPLVMFSCVATGALGYQLGGPVGAYVAAVVSSEVGRLVSGRTKVDIVVTPIVVIVAGSVAAKFVGPGVSSFMTWLGSVINAATVLQPGVRVGVPWLHRTCGVCEFCRTGRENLCDAADFTGWTVDGGYAEYLVVPRLDRQVHMLADLRQLCNSRDQSIRQVLGVRCHEADAMESVDGVYHSKQACEVSIAVVAVHILPDERYLTHA